MNILFLTYQGDMAGSTNSISYLVQGLARKGHNIFLGCRKESLLYSMVEGSGVHLVPMNFRSRFDLKNMRQIRDAVKTHDIQIINAQSSLDRYTSVLSRWMYGLQVKIVHTRRQRSESMGGFLQNWLYVKGTDKIIAVSNGVKQSLIERRIPERHIEVIYNGTPREKYLSVDEETVKELRIKYNIQPGDFVIGCVSRKKKQEQILRALNFLPFKTKLIFVGIGEEREYEKLLASLGEKHEIYFAGILPNDQALNYFPLFTIKVLASTIEGLSQSILEAMALGIPVIATDYAGNPELIRDEVNGLLFPDNNINLLAKCIIKFHDEPATRIKLAEAGKKTAFVDFSIEKTIEHYERFFYNIADRLSQHVDQKENQAL